MLLDVLKEPPRSFGRALICSRVRSCHSQVAGIQQTSSAGAGDNTNATGANLTTGIPVDPSQHIIPGTHAQPSSVSAPSPSLSSQTPQVTTGLPRTKLGLFFGTQRSQVTTELSDIDHHHLASDPILLRQLKSGHQRLRGRLRNWLSFWRLSHWKFVKVAFCSLKVSNAGLH